jgi:dihydrofolate reductase
VRAEQREKRTMRRLVVGTFLTLDGVMQAPGGPSEDRDDAFLLGRKTHEIFAAAWPTSTDPADEIATALNTRPKFVASRTLDKVSWNNSHLLKGDVAAEVAKLKTQDGGEMEVGQETVVFDSSA